jgi:hypothetical protein
MPLLGMHTDIALDKAIPVPCRILHLVTAGCRHSGRQTDRTVRLNPTGNAVPGPENLPVPHTEHRWALHGGAQPANWHWALLTTQATNRCNLCLRLITQLGIWPYQSV